jgi:DNA polymerase
VGDQTLVAASAKTYVSLRIDCTDEEFIAVSEQLPSPHELARQARWHLESLRASGVEWLPLGKPLELSIPGEPEIAPPAASTDTAVAEQTVPAAGGGLFSAEGGPEVPVEQRRVALDLLRDQVAGCTRCAELLSTRTQTVFGEGPLDAELCFVGEAPGEVEDRQGRPFVGPAGQLLDKIIAACGFQRDQVYICNILRCRPPGNRLPLTTEATNCREHLEKTLELIRPRYICALGACAAQNLLGTTESIGRLRRRFFEYEGIPVLCTYHPSYLLRVPEKKRDVWEDMKLLLTRMGRPLPKK